MLTLRFLAQQQIRNPQIPSVSIRNRTRKSRVLHHHLASDTKTRKSQVFQSETKPLDPAPSVDIKNKTLKRSVFSSWVNSAKSELNTINQRQIQNTRIPIAMPSRTKSANSESHQLTASTKHANPKHFH